MGITNGDPNREEANSVLVYNKALGHLFLALDFGKRCQGSCKSVSNIILVHLFCLTEKHSTDERYRMDLFIL